MGTGCDGVRGRVTPRVGDIRKAHGRWGGRDAEGLEPVFEGAWLEPKGVCAVGDKDDESMRLESKGARLGPQSHHFWRPSWLTAQAGPGTALRYNFSLSWVTRPGIIASIPGMPYLDEHCQCTAPWKDMRCLRGYKKSTLRISPCLCRLLSTHNVP